jgi:hypothetical protein
MSFTLERVNYSYYRNLADFIKQHYLYTPVNLAIKNTGPSVARDVRIEIKISDKNNVIKAIDEGDLLSSPKDSYSALNSPLFYPKNSIYSTEYLNVKRISDYWLIEAGVNKVQPKSVTWLENTLFLGTIKSIEFPIETTMYSDDLPEPSVKNLIVKVNSEERDATLEDIKELENKRFRNSNEYKEFKERHFNDRD